MERFIIKKLLERKNSPQYHIACAGSLLGIALAKPSSFPVGKVNFMQIDPMTFSEFLCHRRYAGISPDVDSSPQCSCNAGIPVRYYQRSKNLSK